LAAEWNPIIDCPDIFNCPPSPLKIKAANSISVSTTRTRDAKHRASSSWKSRKAFHRSAVFRARNLLFLGRQQADSSPMKLARNDKGEVAFSEITTQ
jgi:hypothetical protein